MEYKTFSIKDEVGISEFLQKHSKHIAGDGVISSNEMISFLYVNDEEDDDREKSTMLALAKQMFTQMTGELIQADMYIRQFTRRQIAGEDVNGILLEKKKIAYNLYSELEILKNIIKEMEDDKWMLESPKA